MLKFLEEPDTEVYAFLTTNNENNVLPTIISRCQTLHLKSRERNEIIQEAVGFNVAKEDAEILSYFYNDGEAIFEYSISEEVNQYMDLKHSLFSIFSSIADGNKKEALYQTDHDLLPLLKTKEDARFALDMIALVFEDVLNKSSLRNITVKSYDTMITGLANNLAHINESLIEILKQRNLINLNLNTGLLLDHLMNFITKE